LSGAGAVVKTGTGTITLSRDSGAFASKTSIDAGTLIFQQNADYDYGGALSDNGTPNLTGAAISRDRGGFLHRGAAGGAQRVAGRSARAGEHPAGRIAWHSLCR
jgi:autotransporter-associated beta strand protein